MKILHPDTTETKLKLSDMIVAKGFPEDYAKVFSSRIEPFLKRLDEADRLIVESCIPVVLEFGEESWLPELPSMSRLYDLVIDPSLKPQCEGNRE